MPESISKLEKTYERERPALVKDSLSLIHASRRGLYEHELRELLGEDGHALAHNELAVYRYRPEKQWDKAEAHFRHSRDLFVKVQDKLYTANVELNLQQVLHFQSRPIDLARIKKCTRILDEANNPRSQKGHELLEGLGKDKR